MAAAKKKSKPKPTRSGTTGRGSARKPAKKAPVASASASARPKPSSSQSSEVEQRWNEYWECRTSLESAVATVREAQERLREAREQERERRATFDRTKQALRDLLEVEPASSSTDVSPGDGSKRLGVVPGARGGDDDLFETDDDREEAGDESG